MLNTNMNQPRLQYHYAQIMLPSGFCVGSFTSSDAIEDNDSFAFIEVPHASDDYMDKYYNFNTDLWYVDSGFTIEATDVNAMYHPE